MVYNSKKDGRWGTSQEKPSHPIALGAHLDHLLWCSARSHQHLRRPHKWKEENHNILSVLVRSSGLVDIHPVLVLPSRSGTLARVLLLPHTLRNLLEHLLESLLVLGVLAHFGGVVVRERYELRV